MSGLHTSSLVVGLLCLAGAAAGAFALPGRVAPVVSEQPPVRVPAAFEGAGQRA